MKPRIRERGLTNRPVWGNEKPPRLDIRPIKPVSEKETEGSLLKLLEKRGNLTTITEHQVKRVKSLYLIHLMDKRDIAAKLKIKFSIIDQWITMFGWEEQRTLDLQRRMSQLIGKKFKQNPNFKERCDRIFSNFESVVEEFLQAHHDLEDAKLSPRDLKTLLTVAKESLDVRMALHGQAPTKQKNVRVDVSGNVDIMSSLGPMIIDATGQNERVKKIEETNMLSLEVVDRPNSDEVYE